jgi:hypothetical protein
MSVNGTIRLFAQNQSESEKVQKKDEHKEETHESSFSIEEKLK